jgi:gamma-glutamylcyclotransferase (GGCT)/AIG2-like uncharacterized protein YtfP
MDELSLCEVRRLVDAANAACWQSSAALGGAVGPDDRRAERRLDALFRTSHTLAVYGTPAPGRPNHHVVTPLGGEWTDGLIEGDLVPLGWGAALGYPGFRPRDGGDAVEVKVLTAPSLATTWPALDRFEGEGYRRILVPIFGTEFGLGQAGERRLRTVANLYSANEASPDFWEPPTPEVRRTPLLSTRVNRGQNNHIGGRCVYRSRIFPRAKTAEALKPRPMSAPT